MMKRYQGIIWIVVLGFLMMWMLFINYKLAGINDKKPDKPATSKIVKLADLKNKTGLVVEVFRLEDNDVICIIPIQTRMQGKNVPLSLASSLAPTLECVKK